MHRVGGRYWERGRLCLWWQGYMVYGNSLYFLLEEWSAGSGAHGEEIPGGGSCWKPKDIRGAWRGGRGAQDHKGLWASAINNGLTQHYTGSAIDRMSVSKKDTPHEPLDNTKQGNGQQRQRQETVVAALWRYSESIFEWQSYPGSKSLKIKLLSSPTELWKESND